jgi:hypothetical protein
VRAVDAHAVAFFEHDAWREEGIRLLVEDVTRESHCSSMPARGLLVADPGAAFYISSGKSGTATVSVGQGNQG